MNIYQETILDLYRNPIHRGQLNDAPSGQSENVSCGDSITTFVRKESDVAAEIKYQGEGCVITLATAELLAREYQGKNINDISTLELPDVIKLLGIELTPSRKRCAEVALDALKKAAS